MCGQIDRQNNDVACSDVTATGIRVVTFPTDWK